MQTLSPVTGVLVAGSGATLFARLLGTLGIPLTPASVTGITYATTDLTTGRQLATSTLTPTTVILPALVTDDRLWTQDSAGAPGPDGLFGYNFKADIPAAALVAVTVPPLPVPPPNWTQPVPAPHRVQIDVAFVPVSGEQFRIPFVADVVPVYG